MRQFRAQGAVFKSCPNLGTCVPQFLNRRAPILKPSCPHFEALVPQFLSPRAPIFKPSCPNFPMVCAQTLKTVPFCNGFVIGHPKACQTRPGAPRRHLAQLGPNMHAPICMIACPNSCPNFLGGCPNSCPNFCPNFS